MRLKALAALLILAFALFGLNGCGGAEQENSLTVCILGADDGNNQRYSTNANLLTKELAEKINEYGNLQIEVVEIPVTRWPDGQEEQEAALKRMQVEIMSGKGPDLFILPGVSDFDENNLIVNPEKSMAAGLFADLTDLTRADPEWEKLIAPVMDAGKYEDRQYLIPLRYYSPMLLVLKEELGKLGLNASTLTESTDSFLSESADAGNIPWKKSVTELVMWNFYSCFDDSAIDYRTQQLNLREEDVLKTVERYQTLSDGTRDTEKKTDGKGVFAWGEGFLTEQNPILSGNSPGAFLPTVAELKHAETEYLILPLPNSRGRMTPVVSYYGAVSASCKNIPAAYDFIRLFLSPTVQSGAVGELELGGQTLQVDASEFDAYVGWPVRGDIATGALWEAYQEQYIFDYEAKELNLVLDDEDISLPIDRFDRGRIQSQLDDEFRISLTGPYYKGEEIDPQALARQLYKLLQAAAVE